MRRSLSALAAVALVAPLTQLPVASSVLSQETSGLDDVNSERIRENVTVGGILAHERVFQRIANEHDGTRASGTSGYNASGRYVMRRLENAGYDVRKQEFTFPFFQALSPAELEQTSPNSVTYETATFTYSGSGEVSGPVVATKDIEIPPQTASTSGCERADFKPAPSQPAVALIQRGTCTFEQKAANAQAEGYEAVIIFNEGQKGRQDLLTGTLGRPFDIPVVGLSFQDGRSLHRAIQQGPVQVRVFTDTEFDPAAKTFNILANSPNGPGDKVFVVGAHLDSVIEGPGINDNGSGTSTILEIAEEMAELDRPLQRRVRFAFWGAEELGLLGSEHYVSSISNRNLSTIVANLNFDMVGSPNYVRFVYDGDGSASEPAGPAGSAQIEDVFTSYFASQGLASDPTPFSGRSDYGPFIEVGIPAGGLFSGAEGVKTERQARVYGGQAGFAYDPCYHQACDTYDNVNVKAIDEMSDAAADAVWTLARSRSGLFGDGSTAQRQATSAGRIQAGHVEAGHGHAVVR